MKGWSFWTYLGLALPGIIFMAVNWAIFINNALGKRWSSMIPPVGGLWVAAACLLSPHKLLALTCFLDPFWILLIYSFVIAPITDRKKEPLPPDETDSGADDKTNDSGGDRS